MDKSNIDKEVFDILNTAKPINRDDKRVFRTALIVLAILIVAGSAFAMYSVLTAPRGEIVSPAPGSLTSRVVEIEGYTKNIPPERRYIWTTVDVKSVGLCWPQRQIYSPNEPFEIKIYEGGPNKEFVVCLYSVDQSYHNDILKWFEDVRRTGSKEGFSMMPEGFRLDDVTLTLEGI